MLHAKYYECHITMLHDPTKVNEIKSIIEAEKWKYSEINGDPIFGSGIKCYATTHFNHKISENEIWAQMKELASKLPNVIRCKIELIVRDEIYKIG